jgi:Tfp pilus assembly protein PilN
VTGFDYLHDPISPLASKIARLRISPPHVAIARALACAVVIAIGASGLEHVRITSATKTELKERATLRTARLALGQAKLATHDLNALIALNAAIVRIRDSGYRRASFLVKLGAQLPSGAWLESIGPDGPKLAVNGRATSIAAVAETLRRIDRASFGHVTLQSVTRILSPGLPPEVAFAIDVDGGGR